MPPAPGPAGGLYPLDILAIAGTPVDLVATNTTVDHLTAFQRGGSPQLGFSRLLRTPGALPDPWHLRPCSLTMQGSLVFSGTVSGYVDRYLPGLGWLREYRALGLAYLANYVPVTDEMTYTDTSIWDQPGTDPTQVPGRTGLTVGQIVGHILTMPTNAGPLAAIGVGHYTSLSPPTLPAATTGDLATLNVIPPWTVRVYGERILQSIEGFVQSVHPNHFLHVQPDGTIRFLDPRTFAAYTVTLNDPADHRWDLPELTRDATDNYSRVVVRGSTLVQAVTLQDQPWAGSTAADGGLAEDFAWGTLTNAQAKAAWLPTDWSQPNQNGAPFATGTCTMVGTVAGIPLDTQHVAITTPIALAANQLGQGAGEMLGWINLQADALGGLVSQYWLARVVANTAAPAGGQSVLTLDAPAPSVLYQSYQLFGEAAGANVVGRRYRVTNPALAHALQLAFPYPVPYVYGFGMAAVMVSSPVGTVFYNATGGGPPYITSSGSITIDPDAGLIYFDKPVPVIVGGLMTPPRWPAVVQALLAVATGTLQAVAPASGYAGTLYTVEGIQRTKYITALEWKDYSNAGNMATYAAEVLDSLKDVVIEGSLPYHGLPDLGYLSPGRSLSIRGNDFVTGWESIALPVVAVDVAFNNGPQGTSYSTTLHLSNRRQPYDLANFLRPNVSTELNLGGGGVFGPGLAESRAESAQLAAQSLQATREATRAAMGPTGRVAGGLAAIGAGFEQAGAVAGGLGGAGEFAGSRLVAAAGAAGGGLVGAPAAAMAATQAAQRLYSPQETARMQEEARRQQDEEVARQDDEMARANQEFARMQAAPQFVPRVGPPPRAD